MRCGGASPRARARQGAGTGRHQSGVGLSAAGRRRVIRDALQTQREVCTQIIAAGGDYVWLVKENQPALQEDLRRAISLPPVRG